MAQNDTAEIREVLEQIRAQLADLSGRVSKLESKLPITGPALPGDAHGVTGPAEAAPVQEQPEPVSEEVLLVISAAVAAFFGERVHIRQIRLVSSTAWAQQGRVSIQASHRLH